MTSTEPLQTQPARSLESEGMTVLKTKTTPKPPKKPRDVWEVTAPNKWHMMLYELGGQRWRGRLSFWEDPTAAITRALQTHEPESFEERNEAKNERSIQRAGRLDAGRARREDQAEAAWNASRKAVEHIPPGQPILLGHYSQRRHERDLERSHNAAFKAIALGREAKDFATRAQGARRRVERQEDVAFIQRRLGEAESKLRKREKTLAEPLKPDDHYVQRGLDPGDVRAWRTRAEASRDEYREQVSYWKKRIEEAGGVAFTRERIKKGDLVFTNSWLVVHRVNRKSLTCKFLDGITPHYDPKVAYGEVRKHVRADEMSEEQREALRKVVPQ